MKRAILSWPLLLLSLTLFGCGGDDSPPAAVAPSGRTVAKGGDAFLLSANVQGLFGTVVLQNECTNTEQCTADLSVTANGTEVTSAFTPRLASNTGYAVIVKTQPLNGQCEVLNGEGTIIDRDVVLTVKCNATAPVTHSLSVHVTGLSSNSVVLRFNNNGSAVTLTQSAPDFTFGSFEAGTGYAVAVVTPPSLPAEECLFTGGGSGSMPDSDLTLQLKCSLLPVVTGLQAHVDVFHAHSVTLAWGLSETRGVLYNLYVSADPGCDFRVCAEKLRNVIPMRVTQFNGAPLKNGQLYFFQVETVFVGGATGLSGKVAARPNTVAFNSTVEALAPAPDGTVYVGGAFNNVGVASGSLVALDGNSGELAPREFPLVSGTVNAIVSDGAFGWFIGGKFTRVGNTPRENLAHIKADGSVDTAFDHSCDGPVFALARFQSTLFVGGKFNAIAPAAAGSGPRNIAAISLIGNTLVDWHPNPNNTVRALALLRSTLYMGGDFTGDATRPAYLAGFTLLSGSGGPVSSAPTTFDLHLDAFVEALAADSDNLYIGGSFVHVGDPIRRGVAKVTLVGSTPTLVQTFRPDPVGHSIPDNQELNPSVKSIVLSADRSVVYLGGSFDTIRGAGGFETRTNLAAVSATTGLVSPWTPNPSGPVTALALSGNTIYAGGTFTTVGTSFRGARFNLAAIDVISGDPSVVFHPDPATMFVRTASVGDAVRALVAFGGNVYLGGSFGYLGRTERRFLAAVNAQGTVLPWSPTANGEVKALLYHNNPFFGGLVYAGGNFTVVNTSVRSNFAALSALTGAIEQRFEGRVNGGPVNALAVLDSAGLYVGGAFQSIGNPAINSPNLAKLFLNDGTIDTLFSRTPNGPVNALIATHDRDLNLDVVYVGGAFSNFGGGRNLAKINGDIGTTILNPEGTDFPGSPQMPLADGAVNTLALEFGNAFSIFAGGAFNTLQDRFPGGSLRQTPGGLAAISINGMVGTGCSSCWNPGPDPGPANGRPQALAMSNVFTVFAGGGFTNIGGGPIGNFAALDRFIANNGNALARFVFPNGPVSALAVSGNQVYIGGAFTGFNESVDGTAAGGAAGNFGIVDATTGQLQ